MKINKKFKEEIHLQTEHLVNNFLERKKFINEYGTKETKKERIIVISPDIIAIKKGFIINIMVSEIK